MTQRATYICEVCGARATSLRRGRCWVCYVRWADARPAGLGAACVICDERRRENLRMMEFQGAWTPMCHNCATRTQQLMPVPRTIEGVRERLNRDRRWRERRQDGRDHRIFAIDRRSAERRKALRDPDGIEWIDAADLIVEIVEVDEPGVEATRIATEAQEEKGTEAPQP